MIKNVVNLFSKYLILQGKKAVKHIIKRTAIFPNKEYKILDKMEYNYHKKIMHYSDDLDFVINNALKQLIEYYQKNYFPFHNEQNLKYYEQYVHLKEENL